jgi:hypothetical protein
LLADPSEALWYAAGTVDERGRPEAVRFAGVTRDPTTQFDLIYENGCRERWFVHLSQQAGEIRVSAVTIE